ncbi:hypothetical protein KY363_07220 [Candidatus Woesearchaeota archaeon]|nr:hypothetical protein [Candidatus Woesearchaeota archaeon]
MKLDPETIFVPGGEYSFSFTGIANKQIDGLDHSAFTQGDLSDYATIEQTAFKSLPKGSTVPIQGTIHFPDSLTPGTHYLRICFMEECPGKGTVCGRTAACAKVIVKAPHSGIYPQLSLTAGNANENEPAKFTATVSNIGDTTIDSCTGFVEVFDIRNNKIGRAELSSAEDIESFGSKPMIASFNTQGLLPGNYSAEASVECDGKGLDANASFRIGTLSVKIIGYSKEISAGSIQRFVTKVESAWNDPIDVRGTVRIYDSNTSVEAKTATSKLDAWKQLDMEAFIDASSLQPKEYSASIEVFYSGKSTTKQGTVIVTAQKESELPAEEVPATGMSTTMITLILVIVVVLLTALNIFLAIYRKKR